MMDKVKEIIDNLFKDYQSGQRRFGISFVDMDYAEKASIQDALQYIEDKGIIKTYKALGVWSFDLTTYGIDVMEEMKKGTNINFGLQTTQSQTIYNINTANNSVIGSQQNAIVQITNFSELRGKVASEIEDEADKEQIQKLINLLEMSIENNVPVSKGFLSNFSDVLSKYSGLIVPIGSLIIKWLLGSN